MRVSIRTVLPKRWRAVVVLLFLLTPFAAAGALARPAKTPFYSISDRELDVPPGTLLRYQETPLPPFYRAKAWRILYSTRDYAGRPIASSGVVVLSDYASANPSQRKIVAWAHPTTGVARKCAPSMRGTPTDWIIGLNEFVAAGYIVAATDYPGLGTEGPIGYLVGKGQARAVIDSVRAARQLPGVGGGMSYALWGYSQGGHAVLFAAQESQSYAPELNLVGVAATAPPTNLAALFQANIGTIEGRVLAAMTLESWSRKFGISLSTLIDSQVAQVVAEVDKNCVDDLGSQLDLLAAQKPLQQKFLNYDPATHPPWENLMSANSLYNLGARVPVFIAQGDADQLVRPEITLQFVRAMCRQKLSVDYVNLTGKGHASSAKASSAPATSWISDRFRGARAPNSCR
jgi:alpha-beta hydrolase superfamily lysophospholipase